MTRFSKVYLGVAAVAAFCLALAGNALAAYTPQDYTPMAEGAGPEVGAAVPVALGVLALFIGILVAVKVARRIIRA